MAYDIFSEEIKNMDFQQDEDNFFAEFQELMRMLVMSKFNIAVELEFSMQFEEAKKQAKLGIKYIEYFLQSDESSKHLKVKLSKIASRKRIIRGESVPRQRPLSRYRLKIMGQASHINPVSKLKSSQGDIRITKRPLSTIGGRNGSIIKQAKSTKDELKFEDFEFLTKKHLVLISLI